MTRWGAYVAQRIDDLRYGKGREDWEGEWPTSAAAEAAWQLAISTFRDDTPTPSVVPTEEGWVAFIWLKNGVDAEIEVGETEALLWVRDRATDEIRSGPVADHRGCCVERLLDRLGEQP